MPNQIEYRGFTKSFVELVNELVAPVSILPIFASDKESSKIPIQVDALWDTGATVTCMKPVLWERLKLHPISTNRIMHFGGGGKVSVMSTLVNLFITSNLEIEYCPVYKADFPCIVDMLIGMDIIRMGDFAVCNADDKTSFSFVIPPFPDRIDFAGKAEAANKFI